MKAVKTHVGRCDTCGEPAAYAQLLPGGRTFRFCEQHAPLLIKKQAEATAASEKEKKWITKPPVKKRLTCNQ